MSTARTKAHRQTKDERASAPIPYLSGQKKGPRESDWEVAMTLLIQFEEDHPNIRLSKDNPW